MAKEESASKRSKEDEEEQEVETTQEEAKETKKGKKSQEATEPQMEQLILNSNANKYDMILLARRWAYELKSKDQEGRSIQELIPQAVKDVLGERVSHKMISELPVLKPVVKTKKAAASSLLDGGRIAPESLPDDDDKPKAKKKKS